MKLLRINQVKELTGLARSTIYRLMALGEFPKCIKLAGRAVAWTSTSIDEWIKSKCEQQK